MVMLQRESAVELASGQREENESKKCLLLV